MNADFINWKIFFSFFILKNLMLTSLQLFDQKYSTNYIILKY